MKINKTTSLITSTLIILAIITASCGKKKETKKEPTLEEKLIGTWQIVINPSRTLTFKKQGKCLAKDEAHNNKNNKSVKEGTWKITNDKKISITIDDELLTATFDADDSSILRVQANGKHNTVFTLKKRTDSNTPLKLSKKEKQLLITKAEKKTIERQNRNTCIYNLKHIAGSKALAMLDKDLPDDTVLQEKEIAPYLKEGALPKCPSGGTYSINRGNQDPTCSCKGHELK